MIEDEDIEDMDEKIELEETDEDINNTPRDSIEPAEDDIEQEEKEEIIEEPEHLEVSEEVEVEDPKIEVRMEYADSMITDTMARRMIKNEREVIYTDGRSRSIINVDTLSRNFMADDRVDVNILKKKSLVPYDTNYIKVLARGAIDKPLHVFANEFSLSAVKMILLSGGEAIRVISEKADKKEK
jgi:ribosomal protein L15